MGVEHAHFSQISVNCHHIEVFEYPHLYPYHVLRPSWNIKSLSNITIKKLSNLRFSHKEWIKLKRNLYASMSFFWGEHWIIWINRYDTSYSNYVNSIERDTLHQQNNKQAVGKGNLTVMFNILRSFLLTQHV